MLVGEGGNADSWIVVEGSEKNGETRGALSSGFRFEEGGGKGEEVTAGWERGEETENGGMVGGGPFLFYIPSALSLPSETPASLPQSLTLFSPPRPSCILS